MTTTNYAEQARANRNEANRLFAYADRLFDNGQGAAGMRKIHEARRLLALAEEYERLASAK